MREAADQKKGLQDLIAEIDGTDLVMVEIGSYAGESAEIFAKSGKFKLVFCVDPWITDPNGDELNSYKKMDRVEQRFDQMAARNPRVVKCKGTIDTLVETMESAEDGPFAELKKAGIDFAYIDGLHTYEGASHDIETLKSKLPPRIAMSGHDYTDKYKHVAGVKKAVDELLGGPDKTFVDTSWMKRTK